MHEMLEYVTRRRADFIQGTVSVPLDLVTDTSFMTFVFYYAVDGIRLE